jgi:chaperonin GroES
MGVPLGVAERRPHPPRHGARGGIGPTRVARWTSAPRRWQGDEEPIMKIRPLQDRIVVKRLESESTTKGGIIIPDTAKEKPIEGRVIAVGNGKILKNGKARPLDVKVGDVVLFGKYSGNEVKLDGDDHVLIREDDVLAILRSGEAS